MTEVNGFVPRNYAEIVRDLLTTLTGGTVRESVVVPAGDVIELRLLADRPIRRVSHLEGHVEVVRTAGDGSEETVEVPYRFTDADFELFATGAEGDENDAIRFRPNGRRPPVGSTVTVNYYPSQTRAAPITDLNVGSVARTLLESVGRELALEELLMERVYRSAFLDTAEGSNLDKVVALVGITRRPAGVATTRVRFTRAPGSTGRISIPVSTTVSDADGNRYSTAAPLVLEPGEPSRQVLVAAVSPSTAAVASGAIDRMEVLVAGVASVTNESPATLAAAPEADDDLRRRARGALAVSARGTVDALEYGLRSIPGVKDVSITEFPNGVPGEIAVDVAYEREGDAELEAAVAERISDLRPAGVRVIAAPAAVSDVTVSAVLTLVGSGVSADEIADLQSGLERRVVEYIQSLPPGGAIRQAQVVMAALTDTRLIDAAFEFSTGGHPAPSVTAASGAVLRPVRPFTFTIETETGEAGPGTEIAVDVLAVVHLVAGVTAADAEVALTAAAQSWTQGLKPGATITVDGLLAALRDDTRYALVRADTAMTTETVDRFLQLADGTGSHPIGPGDRVRLRNINVDVREGGA